MTSTTEEFEHFTQINTALESLFRENKTLISRAYRDDGKFNLILHSYVPVRVNELTEVEKYPTFSLNTINESKPIFQRLNNALQHSKGQK